MGTEKRTKKPDPPQALPEGCTLADIVISWREEGKTRYVKGEHVALTLALVYRRMHPGQIPEHDMWDFTADPIQAQTHLRGIEQILRTAQETHELVDSDWFLTLADVMRDVQVRCEMAARPVKASEYRIHVGELERTPRVVISNPAQAA